MTVASPPDDELWYRVRTGDQDALTVLYERHAPAIFNHCYQRLLSRPDAEDITAEVFSIALAVRGRVTIFPELGIRPWLFGVANNLLRRHHSARSAGARLAQRVSSRYADVTDIAERCADLAEDHYYVALLAAVLRKLSADDQDIIQLCVLQGLPPTVVARITGARPGTVRSRLSRALSRARRHLAALADVPTPTTVVERT